MWLVLLLSCSEQKLTPITEDPAPAGDPSAWVDPVALDLGVVCGEVSRTVAVGNRGDADLTITEVAVTGEGWSVSAEALPVVVGAGAAWTFLVVGGEGPGTLSIRTDDPANPVLTVPLAATADAPPTVVITEPATGAVLPGTGTTPFVATLADDADAPDTLAATWASSVDGALGPGTVDGTGLATYAWEGAARSPGTHTVTLTATDSCGGTASASIEVCQDEGYEVDDLDLSTWHFEGVATWDGSNGWIQLTDPSNYVGGTAFQTAATVDSDNVVIDFLFYIGGGSGADGISLTALDTTRMTGFVGEDGGGIGYGGLPGWSLEVDTWYNAELNDPTTEDHLSLHLDGNTTAPVLWAALPEMEDNGWHEAVMSVTGEHVTVAIDGVTYIDQSVSGIGAFPAYVGFTAATGGSTNYHLIDSLRVTRYVCEG